jgi:hypothetical protein
VRNGICVLERHPTDAELGRFDQQVRQRASNRDDGVKLGVYLPPSLTAFTCAE